MLLVKGGGEVARHGMAEPAANNGRRAQGFLAVPPSDKLFVSARTLLLNSVRLARKVWADGYLPDYLVAVWRGGTPPGIVMHEYFRLQRHEPYHTTIKTQSYRGLQRGTSKVEIKGLDHIVAVIKAEDRLLLVDDVFDSGHTMAAVLAKIHARAPSNRPECRIATVYSKPEHNETNLVPDYCVVEDNRWIVFPHELEGLTEDEIRAKGSRLHEALYESEA